MIKQDTINDLIEAVTHDYICGLETYFWDEQKERVLNFDAMYLRNMSSGKIIGYSCHILDDSLKKKLDGTEFGYQSWDYWNKFERIPRIKNETRRKWIEAFILSSILKEPLKELQMLLGIEYKDLEDILRHVLQERVDAEEDMEGEAWQNAMRLKFKRMEMLKQFQEKEPYDLK